MKRCHTTMMKMAMHMCNQPMCLTFCVSLPAQFSLAKVNLLPHTSDAA